MNVIKKFFLSICTSIFLASFLTACNTAQGFGEDLQQGGKAISKAAKEEKTNN